MTVGRLLLVDDDEFFRALTAETLTAHGHEVRLASDALSALAMAAADPPDVILLDVLMPQVDGFEAMQVLRQEPATSSVPVLLITAQRDENHLLRGLRLGAEDVLFKPLQMEELLLRIEHVLRSKKHMDALGDLIRRHLDPSVAFQLLQQPDQMLALKRTHLAVLFSDLRGFTALAEGLQPEQTAALLNELFEGLVRCVLRYGGTLDKFLGDGLMALFGAPVEYPDNENRAVCAALDMLVFVQDMDARLRNLAPAPVDLGIGISAGEVVVGPLGSRLRQNYTAVGDTVNVAARLTALARGREIIVSESVRDRLHPQVQVEALPPAVLKGKRNPLPIFRVKSGQALTVFLRRKT